MNIYLESAKFAAPYLGRYWPRFILGIVLGILFGVSNGISVGSVYILSHRVVDPAGVQQITDEGLERKAEAKALKAEKKAQPDNASLQSLKAKGLTLKQEFYVLTDPWLPLRGRALDWKQCLGGFLFIPLTIALRGVIGYGSSYLLAWAAQRITNDVKSDVFRKISTFSLDFFQKMTTAEIINRIEADGTVISTFLRLGLSDLVKEPSVIICLFGAMLMINWKFTVVALVFTPLCAIPTRIVARRIKELGKRDFGAAIRQGNITVESFQNVRITKAYGLEEMHGESFRKAGLQSAHFAMKSVQSREMLNPIVQTLTAMGPSAVLLYAVATNSNLDTVVAFITALFAFGASVKKISTLGVYFLQMSLAMERLLGLFAMKPSVKEAENPVALPGFTRALEFRNVDFSYGDAPVLQEVSFTLRRGQRLGLAGENGSGKSSLLNLLFRFYDPTDGEILLDGIPLTELRLSDLRFQLALVSQDILLFNGTVAENIAAGKLGASREEIIIAAKEAHAHNFITELPKGYDTPLGERGLRLSGGQRQRISIARAFVRNAPILVLDEATAALDAQSEAEVQKAIDHLAEHRTVICVAHRLSTLRTMDQILVLSQGRVVEQGNFEQLLALGGIFTAMAARQSIHPLSPAPV